MTSAQPDKSLPETISLDIHRMDIDKNGVRNFFWPVSYKTREAFSLGLMNGFTALIREYDQPGSSINCYKIMTKYFTNEAITIFWADALHMGFAAQNKKAVFPSHLRIWPSTFSNAPFPDPGYLNTFRNKSASASPLKKFNFSFLRKIFGLVQWGKGGAKIDGMSLKRITPEVLHNYIISTQRTSLIARHARTESSEVVFCRSERWFSPVTEQDLQCELSLANTAFEEALIHIVSRLYSQWDIPFGDRSKNHLSRVLREGAALLRVHERRLNSSKIAVPQTIWTGTAGYIWDTLLRLEVLRRGGNVTGHDHGAGQGHVDNPITGFSELWGCNEYMTFNKQQAESLTRGAEHWPMLDKKPPAVTFPDGQGAKNDIYSRFEAPDFRVKTIAFLATIYDGERGRMGPSSPDIIHVDWQARLIEKLTSWGYDVVIKIHPESAILPPKDFTMRFGARLETRKLEDVLDDLDLLLFDSVYTTALYAGLKTNMPMALIDFYQHPWLPEAKEMFMKRSPLLDGWFDEQNRKQIDWNALRRAIEEAPSKNNNSQFFCYYYG